jgi:hypothetical protein
MPATISPGCAPPAGRAPASSRMSHLIAAIGLRLALATLLYIGTAAVWIGRANGWAVLELFVASIMFGVFAAVALIAAMTLCRRIANPLVRLLAQPPLTVLLFVVLVYVIAGGLMGMHNDIARDMARFVGLVAVIAVVDAALGYGLDRWVARKQALAGP